MPIYTPDNIALGIIAEGRRSRTGQGQLDHPVISEKGMVQAIACGLVETNLRMLANEGDPDTLAFPHDGVGSDSLSAGVHQQQPPWWGTAADRMDVARSTAMFFNSLVRQRINGLDYNTEATTPGMWVAMVQNCRGDLRGKYDQRWAEATRIYKTLAGVQGPLDPAPTLPVALRPDFTEVGMFGWGHNSRSRKPINFLFHTQEGPPGHEISDATAEDLAQFCQGQNDVSYHYTARDRIVYDVVDTDRYSWSVLDANMFTINFCFAGSSVKLTRQQWIDKYGADIDIGAYIAVQDARKYGFSTTVIRPPYRQGQGISDHKYVTECLHIGTHSDVGPNFPWDLLEASVIKYTGEGADDDMIPQDQWQAVYEVITRKRPSKSIYRTHGESPVGDIADMIANGDGMAHQELVERLAIVYNDADALSRVHAVAEGRGADPDDVWAVNHAKEVLVKIAAKVQ